jgi:hypothetical protein
MKKARQKPGSLERQDFGPPGTGASFMVETDLEPKPDFSRRGTEVRELQRRNLALDLGWVSPGGIAGLA